MLMRQIYKKFFHLQRTFANFKQKLLCEKSLLWLKRFIYHILLINRILIKFLSFNKN